MLVAVSVFPTLESEARGQQIGEQLGYRDRPCLNKQANKRSQEGFLGNLVLGRGPCVMENFYLAI